MQINIQHKKKALFYLRRLSDIRYAGQLLFVIIVLMISWSGIKSIQTNYGLQKQISKLNQQNSLKQLENNNLSLQNNYYKSNQYLELSARRNFGLAAPGEKEIIVPKSVALTYAPPLPESDVPEIVTVKQPGYQRNIESWVNFFLHRPSNN